MSNVLATYSAKDVNCTIVNSALGVAIQVAGVSELGLNKITVRMSTTRSTLKVSADGAVVPSVVPGDNGEIEVEVWQTGTLHQQLLSWFNSCKVAADAGDVSNWFGGTMIVQSTVAGGALHLASGVAPQKPPDKTYQTEAQLVNWVMVCASISNQ